MPMHFYYNYGQKHNSIDHDFKRSDSGSDSGLSGNGVSVHPIPVSDAQGGDGEMSIGALPAPAVPDNQETNNIATLINETVTYAIDKNNTQSVTCEIDEDEFFVMTINSKCKVHCILYNWLTLTAVLHSYQYLLVNTKKGYLN